MEKLECIIATLITRHADQTYNRTEVTFMTKVTTRPNPIKVIAFLARLVCFVFFLSFSVRPSTLFIPTFFVVVVVERTLYLLESILSKRSRYITILIFRIIGMD